MRQLLASTLLILAQLVGLYSYRLVPVQLEISRSRVRSNSVRMQMSAKNELNQFQLWRLSLKLQKEGCKSVEALARIRFIQDANYEPPQGRIFVEDDFNGFIKVDNNGYSGIWTLSEDKNDRKDGLWICMRPFGQLLLASVIL